MNHIRLLCFFLHGFYLVLWKRCKKDANTCLKNMTFFFFNYWHTEKNQNTFLLFSNIDVIHSLDGSTMNMLHGECYMLTPEILIHGHKSIFFFLTIFFDFLAPLKLQWKCISFSSWSNSLIFSCPWFSIIWELERSEDIVCIKDIANSPVLL